MLKCCLYLLKVVSSIYFFPQDHELEIFDVCFI